MPSDPISSASERRTPRRLTQWIVFIVTLPYAYLVFVHMGLGVMVIKPIISPFKQNPYCYHCGSPVDDGGATTKYGRTVLGKTHSFDEAWCGRCTPPTTHYGMIPRIMMVFFSVVPAVLIMFITMKCLGDSPEGMPAEIMGRITLTPMLLMFIVSLFTTKW
jgi:hypothetical protein